MKYSRQTSRQHLQTHPAISKKVSSTSRQAIRIRFLVITACLVALAGCSLRDIHEQFRVTENFGVINGTVKQSGSQQGPIMVNRYHKEGEVFVQDSHTRAGSGGKYLFYCLPGAYYIAAYIDVNKDGQFQQGEDYDYHGSSTGQPAAVRVNPGQTVSVEALDITGNLSAASGEGKIRIELSPVAKNLGRIVVLDDPMFVADNYSLGMWKPIEFLTRVGGGLLFLQPYQANKIPVLFIHGINGGPTDWETAIRQLDRARFQPWVLYYPSGLRLNMISDYLAAALSRLHDEYGFNQLFVVAHSMGGLITRSFVRKYLDRFPDQAGVIRLVMTVNSPMAGMGSAASGVSNSPLVVPAWRDVATDSDFLQDLHSWTWPAGIPYHLVFSYKTGGSNDGTVSLQSQIPLKLQAEAVRIYGFNQTHAEILNDPAFLELFHSILANGHDE
jgi:pimeloyl-ACP methyl ester carboxylesterase